MARLINAKALEKQIKEAFKETNPVLMGQMLRWVRKQKTIDAVSVVRCKDCKAWNRYEPASVSGRCSFLCMMRMDDDYCSYGERGDGNV